MVEDLVVQADVRAGQSRAGLVMAQAAAGPRQNGVGILRSVEHQAVILELLPLRQRTAESGVAADAEGHGGRPRVHHPELGEKAVFSQLVPHPQGKREGIPGQRLRRLPQFQLRIIVSLSDHGKLHPPGEAVAVHLIRLSDDTHRAVLQAAHDGKQNGVPAAPIGRVASPDILRPRRVPQRDQLAAHGVRQCRQAAALQYDLHRLPLFPLSE